MFCRSGASSALPMAAKPNSFRADNKPSLVRMPTRAPFLGDVTDLTFVSCHRGYDELLRFFRGPWTVRPVGDFLDGGRL